MGGDGSLGCFIDDLRMDDFISMNLSNLVLVPLPYGTGNDLSRSLGWGNREGPWGRDLETLATALMNAKQEMFTVWDVNIYAEQVEGYAKGGRVVLEAPNDVHSDL